MNYEDRLQNVTVLGAAGKMGSGILLLTALEMADLGLKPENRSKSFVLNAVDISNDALKGVMKYLRKQVLKAAEKKTVLLRKMYQDREDLIENSDIIHQYVEDVLSIVHPTLRIESAYDSRLIFEAVNENKDLKVKLFSQIDKHNPEDPWFFTNTSSVPIGIIDQEANLGGRILGFHFYNPPAVQKLVELILSDNTLEEVRKFALAYAGKLRKVVVPSNDVAGFIGNGHFMRDALYGIREAERLAKDMPYITAIYLVNKVTQDFLVRPMGIFQLIDYVGIDVVRFIMQVMDPHMKDEELHSPLLDMYVEQGIRGGQNPDGSQKDGFFRYEKGKIAAIYGPYVKKYIPVDEIQETAEERFGEIPGSYIPWKATLKMKDKDAALKAFFDELKTMDTLGAKLAVRYGRRSKEIGEKLVRDNVARSAEDVNTVLLTGFFHAYGPINEYFD